MLYITILCQQNTYCEEKRCMYLPGNLISDFFLSQRKIYCSLLVQYDFHVTLQPEYKLKLKNKRFCPDIDHPHPIIVAMKDF